MIIHFPRNLRTDKKGIEFLSFLWGVSKKNKNNTLYWNLKRTKKIETNLLSFLGLVLKRMDNRKNIIKLITKNNDGQVVIVNENILMFIFEKYSSHNNKLLQYKFLSEKESKEDMNILLIGGLKEFNLLYYSDIKILLSEFIANIFMHATDREGSISGYITDKDEILISVCNMGKTIRQNIEEINKYKFLTDREAIVWALKKTNTTRKNEESGGLGLYLLRKYIFKIHAEAIIISGKSLVKLSGENCFNELKVNDIYLEDDIEMKGFFPGTIITLKFKNEKNYMINNKIYLHEIELFN
ncbi:MAG: hypothetical protein E7K00_04865 [Clostridium perfringens]|nr:hypothetical protein [Clostridium perfringens]BDC01930.1 hypothetical protein CP118TE_16390 [Clostridium perfringens E]CAJ1609831.1 hypothetical protein CLO5623_01254 [Clostridium perfringens]